MSFRDMTPTDTSTSSPTFSSSKSLSARFDHEKLDEEVGNPEDEGRNDE